MAVGVLALAGAELWRSTRGPAIEGAAVPVESSHREAAASDRGETRPPAQGSQEAEPEADDARRTELTRFPNGEVVVRVVDGRGAPRTGVEVQLVHAGTSTAASYWSGITEGAAGEARLRSLDAALALVDPVPMLAFEIAGLGMECDREPFDPAKPPREPIVLTLPGAGAIEVLVRSSGGEIVGESFPVEIAFAPGSAASIATPVYRSKLVRRTDREGRALFEPLATGLEWAVGVRGAPWYAGAGREVLGPASWDEVVTVELDVGARRSRLVGRLCDADGRPLTGCAFSYRISHLGVNATEPGSASSDAEGRFALHVLPRDKASAVLVEINRGHDARFGAMAQWSVDIALPFIEPDAVELGDVKLGASLPVLASGSVHARDGSPLRGAGVSALDPSLRPALVASTTTNEEGRFVLRGRSSAAALRLRANAERFRPRETQLVARGTEGLAIELDPLGAVAGRVLLGFEPSSNDVWVSVEPVASPWDSRSAAVAPDGSFEVANVDPGLHDVVVQVGPCRTEVVRLEEVSVAADAPPSDARLAAIDARGRAISISIEVTDITGASVPNASASVLCEKRSTSLALTAAGTATLTVPPGGVDVLVRARGYRVEASNGLAQSRRFVLAPAIELTLELDHSVPLPPAGTGLRCFISLAPTVHADAVPSRKSTYFPEMSASVEVVFGDIRRKTVELEAAGVFEVSFHLAHDGPDGRPSGTTLPAAEACRRVEIGERDHGRVLIVAPDPDAYAEWLDG